MFFRNCWNCLGEGVGVGVESGEEVRVRQSFEFVEKKSRNKASSQPFTRSIRIRFVVNMLIVQQMGDLDKKAALLRPEPKNQWWLKREPTQVKVLWALPSPLSWTWGLPMACQVGLGSGVVLLLCFTPITTTKGGAKKKEEKNTKKKGEKNQPKKVCCPLA